MNNEDHVINRALVRQARPPAAGKSVNEVSAGRISSGPSRDATTVGSDGKVRRLWTPGDPWSDDFYFGASD